MVQKIGSQCGRNWDWGIMAIVFLIALLAGVWLGWVFLTAIEQCVIRPRVKRAVDAEIKRYEERKHNH